MRADPEVTRAMLRDMGIPTFFLVHNREGVGILCFICWHISWHPDDVKEKYCGHCHRFHEEGV